MPCQLRQYLRVMSMSGINRRSSNQEIWFLVWIQQELQMRFTYVGRSHSVIFAQMWIPYHTSAQMLGNFIAKTKFRKQISPTHNMWIAFTLQLRNWSTYLTTQFVTISMSGNVVTFRPKGGATYTLLKAP